MKSLDYLSSIHTEKATILFRLIRLAAKRDIYSDFSELLILFAEYAQLLAQCLLATFPLYPYLNSNVNSNNIRFENVLNPLSKIFDLSYLISYGENYTSIVITTSVIGAIFSIFLFGMIIYVFYLAITRRPGHPLLLGLWRRVFNVQGRIINFYMTSFCAGVLRLYQDRILGLDIWTRYLIWGVPWAIIIIMSMWSIAVTRYFVYVLPTKNLLASKSGTLGAVTQIQKMIVLLLVAFLSDDALKNRWVYPIIGFVFDLLRLKYFFQALPFYKSKALFIQVTLLAIVLAFNMASLAQAVLQALNYSPSTNLLVVNWIILSVIATFAVRNHLRRILFQNITKSSGAQPEIMSHKIYLMKELRGKYSETTHLHSSYSWELLVATTLNVNPKSMFGMNSTELTQKPLASKTSANELHLKYIHSLLVQFPKNDMLKLNLAYLYAKKQKKYAIALKLLDELMSSSSYIIRCNAALLTEDVQAALRRQYENSDSKLDMFTFNRNVFLVVELKKNMLKQCELQVDLYKEMHLSSPNLARLFNLSQDVHRYRSRALRNMKYLKETMPECYLEPLALCAYYQLVSNHTIPAYFEYMRIFSQRYQKYEKVIKGPELCKENLYSKRIGVAIVSGLKDKTGMITYANKAFKHACGKDPIGNFVYNLTSPFLQPFWKLIPKTFAAYQGVMTANPIQKMYFYNNGSGYIIPGSCFINIHPYICKGHHYMYVFRPIPNPKEIIILSKNGDIQTSTEKIAKKLRLKPPTEPNSSSGTPVKEISTVLDQLSRAHDLIVQFENRQAEGEQNMELMKAKELYTQYSTTGGIIKVQALNPDKIHGKKEVYEFHCKMEVGGRGNITMKVITLDEIETKKGNSKEICATDPSEEEVMVLEKKNSEHMNGLTYDDEDAEEIPTEDKPSIRTNIDFIPTGKSRETTQLKLDSQSALHTPRIPLVFQNQTLETEPIMSSSRQLLITRPSGKTNEESQVPRKSSFSPQKQEEQHDSTPHQGQKINVDIDSQSLNSQKPNSSSQIAKMKAFHDLLASDRSPKKYKVFICLLIGMVLALVIHEGLTKGSLDAYVSDLKARKDVLSMARMRNIRLMDIHRNTRFLWLMAVNGDQNIRENIQKAASSARLSNFLKQVANADKNLRGAVNLLDVGLSKTVFENNVKMYDSNYNDTTQTFITMNTFDATTDIIAACLQIIKMVNNNATGTLPRLNFVLRNIINDILIRTESVVNLLITLLENDRIAMLKLTTIFTILPSFLLAILVLMFIYLLHKFYLKEKHMMNAFTHLDLKDIKTVQQRIVKFTQMIEDEVSFEEAPPVDISEFLYRRDSRNKLANKAKSTSNYKGIRTKYMLTAIKLLVLMLFITAVVETNLGLGFVIIDKLETKVHQLQVTSAISEKITLSASILLDMVYENDTTLILNNTPSVIAVDTLNDISVLKDQILHIFQTSSASQAQVLEPLLFEDQCSILPNIPTRPYCAMLTQGQNQTGFIQMLAVFEFFFTDIRNGFLASNRSSEALYPYQIEVPNIRSPEIIALQDLSFLIWGATDQDLQKSIQDSYNQNNISMIVLVVVLVVISLLFYYVILMRLRDADNQLRRVLQTLPANLILSNFLLKSYLLKIAKGRLDFLRNEI